MCAAMLVWLLRHKQCGLRVQSRGLLHGSKTIAEYSKQVMLMSCWQGTTALVAAEPMVRGFYVNADWLWRTLR